MNVNDPPSCFNDPKQDELHFENWMLRVKGKLESNADHFANEALNLEYAVSILKGDVALPVNPRLCPNLPGHYQAATDLLEHLTRLYKEPDTLNTAKSKYYEL